MGKRPDPMVAEGHCLLEQWGVPEDAAPEQLREHMARSAAADLAIVDRLAARGDSSAVACLAEVAESSAGDVRRHARRALYRLDQRGIRPPPRPDPDTASRPAEEAIDGYLSPIDHRGDRIVVLVRPVVGGTVHLKAVVSDTVGLRKVSHGMGSRKDLKRFFEDFARQIGNRFVRVDGEYADALMRRGFELATGLGREIDGDYGAARGAFRKRPAPTLPDRAPIYEIIGESEAEALTVSRPQVEELFVDARLALFWLAASDLDPWMTRLRDADDSPLVLSEMQKRGRREEILDHAARELLTGERRHLLRSRLESVAYDFEIDGRPAMARAVLACARQLLRPPSELYIAPFWRWVLDLWVVALSAPEPEKPPSGGSVVSS